MARRRGHTDEQILAALRQAASSPHSFPHEQRKDRNIVYSERPVFSKTAGRSLTFARSYLRR